jgi:hypothetical protein
MTALSRQDLHRWIDSLPEAKLAKFMAGLAALQDVLSDQPAGTTPYTPIKLGGLWTGVNIDEEQFVQLRHELWANFGKDEP